MAEEYFDFTSSDHWDRQYSMSFTKTFMTVLLPEQSQVHPSNSVTPES